MKKTFNTSIVRFTKTFTKGNLKGTKLHESLPFPTIQQATKWIVAIQSAKTLDYQITDVQYELINTGL